MRHKKYSFHLHFSTLLPGDMVVARLPLFMKMTADGEVKVKIEGLGYLRAHVRKEEGEKA